MEQNCSRILYYLVGCPLAFESVQFSVHQLLAVRSELCAVFSLYPSKNSRYCQVRAVNFSSNRSLLQGSSIEEKDVEIKWSCSAMEVSGSCPHVEYCKKKFLIAHDIQSIQVPVYHSQSDNHWRCFLQEPQVVVLAKFGWLFFTKHNTGKEYYFLPVVESCIKNKSTSFLSIEWSACTVAARRRIAVSASTSVSP